MDSSYMNDYRTKSRFLSLKNEDRIKIEYRGIRNITFMTILSKPLGTILF